MKELYKIILSSSCAIIPDDVENIYYTQTIYNHINYDRYALKFKVSFRKDHRYIYFNDDMPKILHWMILWYYNYFKIIFQYYDDLHCLTEDNLNKIVDFICCFGRYYHFIYLLKKYTDTRRGDTILHCFFKRYLEHSYHRDEDFRVFKYLKSSPYYSKLLLTHPYASYISQIFNVACVNNQCNLVSLILSIKCYDTLITMTHIKQAVSNNCKDLVIILYNAWLQQIETDTITAKDLCKDFL